MTSDARRFRFSLAGSLLVNALLLPLAAWLWRPLPVPPPPVRRAHIRLVTLALRPVQRVPTPRVVVPPPRPLKLHVPPKPPRPRPRHRPGAHVRAASPTPPALPTGGAETGAPAPTAIAPAVPLKIVTATRPSPRVVPHIQTPAPAFMAAPPALVLAPLTINAPALPTPLVAAGTGGGGKSGKGTGTGAGNGQGNGAGPGVGKTNSGPFGVGAGLPGDGAPRHIVYVLDISGSMTSRIDRADQELRGALRGLRPGETFNIVAFSGGNLLFDPDMASATPMMVQKASAFLDALQIGGGTNLEAAVTRALMLRDVNEVVVLTDGVPTVGETDFKRLAQVIRRFNIRHARISTVGMVGRNPDNTDNSFEAAGLLREIASESGGASKIVPLGTADPQ